MAVDIEKLKAGGFIAQVEKDLFSLRVRIPCGNVTSSQIRLLSDISEKYGRGYLHITVRQGFEIPHIHITNIDKVAKILEEYGLFMGACGARVRVVVSCQGSLLCTDGIEDSPSLAKALDKAYYGQWGLPHKFKMGVSGCPNACSKPQENDLGFVGVGEPVLLEREKEECTACGLCVNICPGKAITLVDDKPVIDRTKCFKDLKCVRVCPQNALKIKNMGWDIYIGGKFGKKPQLGVILKTLVSDDCAIEIAGGVIEGFKKYAKGRERLGDIVERLGVDAFRS